ncbi:MAG: HNH endonuclease [Bryobacteraceae bacterium]
MAEVNAADRTLVRERALGRCEYCGLPESLAFVEHQIDHIIAVKHGGSSEPDNLALSCTLCNRYKGSDIASIDPDTGIIEVLYHPRHASVGSSFPDEWRIHSRNHPGWESHRTASPVQSSRPAPRTVREMRPQCRRSKEPLAAQTGPLEHSRFGARLRIHLYGLPPL